MNTYQVTTYETVSYAWGIVDLAHLLRFLSGSLALSITIV